MNNFKYNVFILDIYNLMYKASWVESENIVTYGGDSFHTEGILGFLKMLDAYIKKFGVGEDTIIYYCFDNSKTSVQKYRKSLSEAYKKTRVEQPEWFYRSLDLLELILKSYRENSYLFRIKFLEADDYCSNIVKTYIKPDDKVLIFSEDADWFRSLQDNVHQYAKGKIYDKAMFKSEYGFEPTYSSICFFKTFYGDDSDNIKPALRGLPKSYFYDIIEKCSTIQNFIYMAKSHQLNYLDRGWILRIEKEESALLLNWNLVTTIELTDIQLESYKISCKFDRNKLQIIYNSLQLLGKVDTKRFPLEDSTNSMFDSMLQGISLARKKVDE
jgi:5'-3' exonuclease